MNRMRELGKIITIKPEPETTPSLADIIQRDKAFWFEYERIEG